MEHNFLIIFVCEHGAAKSIIAATYFNKLAKERNLNVRAIARGTNPEAELSPKTIAGLQHDGLSPAQSAPQKLTLAEVESAERIISFCDLPVEYQNKTSIEQWDDIPPVSEDYQTARDAILEKLTHLPPFSNL
jgi:arsenate reductase (thioredoxin)